MIMTHDIQVVEGPQQAQLCIAVSNTELCMLRTLHHLDVMCRVSIIQGVIIQVVEGPLLAQLCNTLVYDQL